MDSRPFTQTMDSRPFTPVKWWILWASLYVKHLEIEPTSNVYAAKSFRKRALTRHMKAAHTRAYWREDMRYGL